MDIEKVLSKLTVEEKATLLLDGGGLKTAAIREKGIPSLIMTDGTSGVRIMEPSDDDLHDAVFSDAINSSFDTPEALEKTRKATCYPSGASLACSFNPELAHEIGSAIAEECKHYHVGLLYGPGLNTRRTPFDGRGFEYYSEDPVLAGDMAAGMVSGLQDSGVGACVKHFVCNNSNYERTIYDNLVTERGLREIYLAAFERAVKKSHPAAIMASYNKLNGKQTCENKALLTDLVRGEWGFDGVMMSDCGAVKDHLASFSAGLDWEMGFSRLAIEKLTKAVEEGSYPEKELDDKCRKVLKLTDRYCRDGKEDPEVDWNRHHALAVKAAAECIVLLRNEDQILPLSGGGNVLVLGSWAKSPVFQGTGCAIVRAQQADQPLSEIRSLAKECGMAVDYLPGYEDPKTVDEDLIREACGRAASADRVIIFAGAMLPPETDDYNRSNIDIEKGQEALIEAVSKVNHNVIVVLCTCESVAMPWIDDVKAVLSCWYCGEGFGKAAAQILFGKAYPGGKLAVTMPVNMEDAPGYLHFPGDAKKNLYEEGHFVGYRYYDRKKVTPLFPFGYGLSFTEFEYSDLKVELGGDESDTVFGKKKGLVSCTIKNVGKRTGSEVVQLYIGDPSAELQRPVRELKGFCKVCLQPGESKKVSFDITERDLAYWHPEFSAWIIDSGLFRFEVGSSSRDIRLAEEVMVEGNRPAFTHYTTDSHFLDVFKDPHAEKVLFKYFKKWGFVGGDAFTPHVRGRLITAFWGIQQYLDLIVPYQTARIGEAEIQKMIDEMNEG